MGTSRSKKALLNVISVTLSQAATLLMNFALRSVFIYTLGEGYLGLNGLFTTVLNTLSLTELGVGSAITYFLYKPIAENDIERIKSLMHFYKKAYIYIGVSIAALGVSIIPLLKYLVNLETELPVNIYEVYLIYLANSVLSYLFFAYMRGIINAMQKNYLINNINIIFSFFTALLSAAILLITHNYIAYLIVRIILVIINNLIIRNVAIKECPYLKDKNIIKLSAKETRNILSNVKDIFIFRLTTTICNSVDNIAISVILGTVVVGYNSNYELVISSVAGLISLLFNAVAASVGNLNALENVERKLRVYNELNLINYIIVTIAFCGMSSLLNDFFILWLKSENFLFPFWAVWFRCFNMFLVSVLNTCFLFRESMGLFKYGKYRNLLSGIANLILTILFTNLWGITGVFAASVVSCFFITFFVFPKIIFKYGFNLNPKQEIIHFLKKSIFACLLSGVVYFVTQPLRMHLNFLIFVIEIFITIIVVLLSIWVIYRKSEAWNDLVERIRRIISRRI